MGTLRKIGRKIDKAIIQPVVKTVEAIASNPVALLGVGLMFVPGAQGVAAAIGSSLGASAAVAPIVGNAIIQGTLAEAQGGDFLKGAALSTLGSVIAPTISSGVSNAIGGGTVSNIASKALTSGIVSKAGGGDFAQGALTGGIIGGIGEYQQALNQGQFDRAMTESGLAGQTLMSDTDQLLSEIQPSASLDIAGIENKTNLFGLARGLTPAAVSLLLQKSAYKNATKDDSGQTQYSIVAPPTDWKSPEYNQTFTPSAPIDFGTPSLLAGTQWENPQQFQAPQEYNLTNLINTLNYQPVPFVPQQYDMPQQVSTADFMSQFQTPTVGTGEVIGNLGGKPVSIADIISGIQSQYG